MTSKCVRTRSAAAYIVNGGRESRFLLPMKVAKYTRQRLIVLEWRVVSPYFTR